MTDNRALVDFVGEWRLRKTILQADGQSGEFCGTAIWHPTSDGTIYEETGALSLQGLAPLNATRRYRWSHNLGVFFEDGRFFHDVPPGGGLARHWCDPDQYEVAYDFANWPEFNTLWRVKGPRKDYQMACTYTRA